MRPTWLSRQSLLAVWALTGAALALGACRDQDRPPQSSALPSCELAQLQFSLRAQGGSGAVSGAIRMRNLSDACRISREARVSMVDRSGRKLPVRATTRSRAPTTPALRLDGRSSDKVAVVSVFWVEWCREQPPPEDATVTLTIPGTGTRTGLQLFGGGYPGCLHNGDRRSTLTVKPITIEDLPREQA